LNSSATLFTISPVNRTRSGFCSLIKINSMLQFAGSENFHCERLKSVRFYIL
jgi:hypothetical protein